MKIINSKYITSIVCYSHTLIGDLPNEQFEDLSNDKNYVLIDGKLYMKPYVGIGAIGDTAHILYYDSESEAKHIFNQVRELFLSKEPIEIDDNNNILNYRNVI